MARGRGRRKSQIPFPFLPAQSLGAHAVLAQTALPASLFGKAFGGYRAATPVLRARIWSCFLPRAFLPIPGLQKTILLDARKEW